MTTRTKRVVTENIVYIAEDGKEFSNEKDCSYHESLLAYDRACDAYEKLKKFDAYMPLDYDEEGNELTWVYLTSPKDLEVVKAALYCDECTAMDYNAKSYPCWVAFTHNGDGYGDIVGTISDIRENMLRYIDRVIEKQHEEAKHPDV